MGWELVVQGFYDATEPPEVQFQQPKYPSNHQQAMGSGGRQAGKAYGRDISTGPLLCTNAEAPGAVGAVRDESETVPPPECPAVLEPV